MVAPDVFGILGSQALKCLFGLGTGPGFIAPPRQRSNAFEHVAIPSEHMVFVIPTASCQHTLNPRLARDARALVATRDVFHKNSFTAPRRTSKKIYALVDA